MRRSAWRDWAKNPKIIEPLVPVDFGPWTIPWQVDFAGTADALRKKSRNRISTQSRTLTNF